MPTQEPLNLQNVISQLELMYNQFQEQNYGAIPVHLVVNLTTYKMIAKSYEETYPSHYRVRSGRNIPITVSPFCESNMVIFTMERN